MKIRLKDLADSSNIYVKLDKKFTQELLGSISYGKSPRTNVKIANLLKVSYNHKFRVSPTISNWLDGKRSIPIRKLKRIIELSGYSWNDISMKLIGLKGPKKDVGLEIKFPIEVDKKLGRIIGHILGDGSIDKKYRQIFYSNSNKDLLIEFQRDMKCIFGVEPRIWVQKKKKNFKEKSKWLFRCEKISKIPNDHPVGLFYPTIISDILYIFFGEFAKGKSKKIPKISFDAPDSYKIGLVRAFFDDEGGVSYSSHNIRVFQDNIKILKDLKRLLREIDIDTNEIRSYVKRNKKRFYFNITRYENLKKFEEIIGFTSTKKALSLKRLVERIGSSKTFRLGHGQTKNLILSMLTSNPLTAENIRQSLRMEHPKIKWNRGTVRRHLNELATNGKLIKTKGGRSYLWSLAK